MASPRSADEGRKETVSAATLDACRRGEAQALELVLRVESPRLERLLGRLLGPSGEAVEDVLQDTFEAAVRAFPSYRGEAPVASWLARIAVRTALRHLKRPERRRRVPLELVVGDERVRDQPRQEEETESRRLLVRVHEHLAALSSKNRVAFVLHVIEGLPVDQVAALCGASKTATKSRVFLARRRLLWRARRDPELRALVAEPKIGRSR
jgi:RNA polymerase sigma-70 factor (ECF subfamily)